MIEVRERLVSEQKALMIRVWDVSDQIQGMYDYCRSFFTRKSIHVGLPAVDSGSDDTG